MASKAFGSASAPWVQLTAIHLVQPLLLLATSASEMSRGMVRQMALWKANQTGYFPVTFSGFSEINRVGLVGFENTNVMQNDTK
jgi:hypothetical protein